MAKSIGLVVTWDASVTCALVAPAGIVNVPGVVANGDVDPSVTT